MSDSKKISVIIVTINSAQVLRMALDHLKEIYPNMEVIVVDNGSGDGTADMVKVEFPWVKLIESENNGLAAGLNKGLDLFTGDYIYYLGNDTFPEKEVFPGLVTYFEQHPEFGAATTKLVSRDGSFDWDAHRGFPTPWTSFTHFSGLEKLFPRTKLFGGYMLTYLDINKEHEIDATITHSLFIRRNVQEQVGRWDEDFFLFGEDIDMCYRIKQAGWKIMYLPQFKSVHWKGAIIGRKTSKDVKMAEEYKVGGQTYKLSDFKVMIKKWSTESMWIFYDKHMKSKYPIFVTWLVHAGISLMTFVRVEQQKLRNKITA